MASLAELLEEGEAEASLSDLLSEAEEEAKLAEPVAEPVKPVAKQKREPSLGDLLSEAEASIAPVQPTQPAPQAPEFIAPPPNILETLGQAFSGVIPTYQQEVEEARQAITSPESNIGERALGALQLLGSPITAVGKPFLRDPGTSLARQAGLPEPLAKAAGIGLEALTPGFGVFQLTRTPKRIRDLQAAQEAARQALTPAARLQDKGIRDMAGNINLNNVTAPEDVKDVIRESAAVIPKEPTVTFSQIKDRARELDISLDNLPGITPGERAAELTASRNLLVDSATQVKDLAMRYRTGEEGSEQLFTEALNRHKAFQQILSGHIADAGRTLSALRIKAGGTLDLESGTLEEISKRLLDTNPEEAARFLSKPATTFEKIQEYWINSILSGPVTQAANVGGNALMSALRLVEAPVEVAFSKATRTPQKFSAIAAEFAGLGRALPEAWGAMRREWNLGADTAARVEFAPKIGGATGQFIRIPTRALSAADIFFKSINRQASLYRDSINIASREGLKGDEFLSRVTELRNTPTKDMLASAKLFSETQTFTKELGKAGQAGQRYVAANPWLRFIVPFIRTPTNIVKQALERTPIGFVRGAIKRDPELLAKGTVGSLTSLWVGFQAMEGNITGSAPTKPEEARTWYAAGNQPYSLKIGDQWYSYKRLEPFSTILGLTADMVRMSSKASDRELDEMANQVIKSFAQNLTDKTFFSGVADIVEALSDPDRFLESFAANKASSFIPNILKQSSSELVDPSFRDPKGLVEKTFQQHFPVARQGIIPRRDLFGEVIAPESLFPFAPVKTKSAVKTPLQEELSRLSTLGFGVGKSQITTTRKMKVDGEVREIPPGWVDVYNMREGELIKKSLEFEISKPQYHNNLDDEEKIAHLRKKIDEARRKAKSELVTNMPKSRR